MSLPLKKNLEVYKGTTFKLKLRFKTAGDTFDLTGYNIKFQVGQRPPVSPLIFDFSSESDPDLVSIDNSQDRLVTITLPAAATESLEDADLFFQIDLVNPDSEVTRWLIGTIVIFESANV